MTNERGLDEDFDYVFYDKFKEAMDTPMNAENAESIMETRTQISINWLQRMNYVVFDEKGWARFKSNEIGIVVLVMMVVLSAGIIIGAVVF